MDNLPLCILVPESTKLEAMTDISAAEKLSLNPIHDAGPQDPWWRHAVIYQIYPRSFADANGDGIGDLPGITSRLEHLQMLGVDAIWLSPFFKSPQKDAGYDVSDYHDVDPLFGTLADFDAMLARAHELGLRVIVDIVPNHSSDQHEWFQQALAAAPGSAERDRYMFRDGKGANGEQPPNDWKSVFGGRAWTRVTEADGNPGQWYLHLFDSSQPDFNWHSAEVRNYFEEVLRFWLDRGVDGFRIDVAHGMIKADGLPDWDAEQAMIKKGDKLEDATADSESNATSSADSGAESEDDDTETGDGNEGPMWDQDGVHEIYRAWNRVLAEYPGDRALAGEAWIHELRRMARYVRPDEMQQTFNFAYLTSRWDAQNLRDVVTESLDAFDGVGAPSTWVLSNHDVVRHASRLGLPVPGALPKGISADDVQPDERLGLQRARAASLFMLALPGSSYMYQGEELGLPEHTSLPAEVRQDPAFFRTKGGEIGRDGCRVPLPWVADAPAYGFNDTGDAWLPQPAGWRKYAAEEQYGDEYSTFELYRKALRLRRELGLGTGSLAWVDSGLVGADPEHSVAFVNGDILVVLNLEGGPIRLPAGAEVLASSGELDIKDDVTKVPARTAVWARMYPPLG